PAWASQEVASSAPVAFRPSLVDHHPSLVDHHPSQVDHPFQGACRPSQEASLEDRPWEACPEEVDDAGGLAKENETSFTSLLRVFEPTTIQSIYQFLTTTAVCALTTPSTLGRLVLASHIGKMAVHPSLYHRRRGRVFQVQPCGVGRVQRPRQVMRWLVSEGVKGRDI